MSSIYLFTIAVLYIEFVLLIPSLKDSSNYRISSLLYFFTLSTILQVCGFSR